MNEQPSHGVRNILIAVFVIVDVALAIFMIAYFLKL